MKKYIYINQMANYRPVSEYKYTIACLPLKRQGKPR